jgi:hypothetical protein
MSLVVLDGENAISVMTSELDSGIISLDKLKSVRSFRFVMLIIDKDA